MSAGEPAGALDRVLATLEEAGSSLWRRRPFVVATVAAIAVTLAFPALIVLVLARASGAVERLRDAEALRAFVADDATDEDIDALARRLRAEEGVREVQVVDAAAARRAFLRRFPELADLARDEDLALPRSVEARGGASPLALQALARELAHAPGVQEVRYDAEAAERLDVVAFRLRAAAWASGVLALLASGFGMGSVIRMGALARKEQLAVMRLVGAPRLHVRLPFVIEGCVQGALGGLLAAGLVSLGGRGLSHALRALAPGLASLPPSGWALLVAAPAVTGALAAFVSVEAVLRRHARLER